MRAVRRPVARAARSARRRKPKHARTPPRTTNYQHIVPSVSKVPAVPAVLFPHAKFAKMNASKKILSIPEELRPIRNHLAMLGLIGIVLFAIRAVLCVKAGTIPPLSLAGQPVVSVAASYAAWIVLASVLVWDAAAALAGARPSGSVPPQAPGFWAIVPFRLFPFFGWGSLVFAILFADPRARIEPPISLSQSLFVFFLPQLFKAFLLLATGTAGVAVLRLWKRNEGLLPADSRRSARNAGFLAAFFAGFMALSAASIVRAALEKGIDSVAAASGVPSAVFQIAVFVYLAVLCFRFRLAPERPADPATEPPADPATPPNHPTT